MYNLIDEQTAYIFHAMPEDIPYAAKPGLFVNIRRNSS
jgi:hypothetical protein